MKDVDTIYYGILAVIYALRVSCAVAVSDWKKNLREIKELYVTKPGSSQGPRRPTVTGRVHGLQIVEWPPDMVVSC